MASISLNSNLVKTVMLKVIGDGGDANKMLDEIAAKAEALKELHPELSVSIDRAKAMADATVMKAELRRSLEGDPITVPVKVDVDQSMLSRLLRGNSLDSLWSKLFGGGNSNARFGVGSALNTIAGAGPIGGGAILGGGFALLSLLASMVPALFAGGLGAAAFGGLAYPTISGLQQGMTGLNTAQGNYQTASQNLTTAINQSPADMKAYQQTITTLEPDLQKAAGLLTNQQVIWQNLTPAMQRSVIALHDNSAAMKILLPDQKTALDALLKQKAAWDALTPAQQKAASAGYGVANQFNSMVATLEPLVLKVVADLLSAVKVLMPFLLPLAETAGKAIDGLVKGFEKFAASPGFKQFMAQMDKLSGPAITAVGIGLGRVAIAIGKLLEALINPASVKMIYVLFNAIADLVNMITWLVTKAYAMGVALGQLWRRMGHDMANWAQDVKDWLNKAVTWFLLLPSRITGALKGLPGDLVNVGRAAITGLIHGLESVPVIGPMVSLGSKLVGGLKTALGIRSPSTVAMGLGRNFTEGFYLGLNQAGNGVGVNVSGTGGGGRGLTLQVNPGSAGGLEAMFISWLRHAILVTGGGGPKSVQHALGQTA